MKPIIFIGILISILLVIVIAPVVFLKDLVLIVLAYIFLHGLRFFAKVIDFCSS
jgi:hypothetical protein